MTPDDLLLKRRKLRRELAVQPHLKELRIAVLGGSTTQELVDLWEVLLLQIGFRPIFFQSDFGRFYETAVLEPETLVAFRPDLVYLHTSSHNIAEWPAIASTEPRLAELLEAAVSRFRAIWDSLQHHLTCQILQNNCELPLHPPLGNLDAVSPAGHSRFVAELNRAFALEAAARPRLLLNDLHGLAATLGLRQWHDPDRWFGYKLASSAYGSVALAESLTALVAALFGRTRKVLVLDLDNTLWGGIIGEDGVDHLALGRETPLAEAFTAFQQFCLQLRDRGILLAVCSKNDDAVARSGFSHPDSILKLEHFAAFRANWQPKHENLRAIAQELNLAPESFVFVDDNPAERALVAAQIPGIAVPEMSENVADYPAILARGRFFEPIALAAEDLARAALYRQNAQRTQAAQAFATYGDYLDALEMTAEIAPFTPAYLPRIAQLTNKTNQFNLTARRYTLAQLEAAAADPCSLGLYARLTDRFGDNGLVSVVLGHIEAQALHLDLWLMSCRVLKRDLELAMLDALAEHAAARGISRMIGIYIPSTKNGMVADLYSNLGFTLLDRETETGQTTWKLDMAGYTARSRHIRRCNRSPAKASAPGVARPCEPPRLQSSRPQALGLKARPIPAWGEAPGTEADNT